MKLVKLLLEELILKQVTLDIQISVREDQVVEVARLLNWMQLCGGIGHSSNVSVFIDGDGSFRPLILINGESCDEFLGNDAFKYDVDLHKHDVSVELEFDLG